MVLSKGSLHPGCRRKMRAAWGGDVDVVVLELHCFRTVFAIPVPRSLEQPPRQPALLFEHVVCMGQVASKEIVASPAKGDILTPNSRPFIFIVPHVARLHDEDTIKFKALRTMYRRYDDVGVIRFS